MLSYRRALHYYVVKYPKEIPFPLLFTWCVFYSPTNTFANNASLDGIILLYNSIVVALGKFLFGREDFMNEGVHGNTLCEIMINSLIFVSHEISDSTC